MENYYKILNIAENASQDEIKKSFNNALKKQVLKLKKSQDAIRKHFCWDFFQKNKLVLYLIFPWLPFIHFFWKPWENFFLLNF